MVVNRGQTGFLYQAKLHGLHRQKTYAPGAPTRIRPADLRIRRPGRDTVNSITSNTWVCRTRQNGAFRAPKTHSIRTGPGLIVSPVFCMQSSL